MGNKASRGVVATLKEKDAKKHSQATGFDVEEVKALFGQFASLKGSHEAQSDDAGITLTEFLAALGTGTKESTFLQRIFVLFDANHDGLLTFDEFIAGVALLSPNAVPEHKLRFTFQIYDLDNAGRISPANLRTILASSLRENGVALSDASIDTMVAGTFAQEDANHDGFIDFEEYRAMASRNPALLKPLTLNVAELIAQGKGGQGTSTTTAAGGVGGSSGGLD